MVFLAQKFNIFLPAWDIRKLSKSIFLKVNLHHNLLATIGQQKEGNMKHSIVAAGLVTDFLCDGNFILFAFHNHPRFIITIDHDVAPPCHTVEHNGAFHLHHLQRIAIATMHSQQRMLAHPLFRSECHPTPPSRIKHLLVTVVHTRQNFSILCFRRHLLPLAVGISASGRC